VVRNVLVENLCEIMSGSGVSYIMQYRSKAIIIGSLCATLCVFIGSIIKAKANLTGNFILYEIIFGYIVGVSISYTMGIKWDINRLIKIENLTLIAAVIVFMTFFVIGIIRYIISKDIEFIFMALGSLGMSLLGYICIITKTNKSKYSR
jgi:hypothetical protein